MIVSSRDSDSQSNRAPLWYIVVEICIIDAQPTNKRQLCGAIMSTRTKISAICFQHLVEFMQQRNMVPLISVLVILNKVASMVWWGYTNRQKLPSWDTVINCLDTVILMLAEKLQKTTRALKPSHTASLLLCGGHVTGAETPVNAAHRHASGPKIWSVPLMCQKELVDGFIQLVCRWGAGGNRAETYRAHTLTLIPEFPDTENSAWSYRSVCSQRQRVDYKDRCPMVLQESFPMIQVSIPSMEKEVDESGKTKKVRTRHFSVIGFFCFGFFCANPAGWNYDCGLSGRKQFFSLDNQ